MSSWSWRPRPQPSWGRRRSVAPGPAGPGWRRLAGSGFLGALAPEDRGGLGLLPSDLALLTEEAGRVLLPGPVVETLWVGVPALVALGDPAAGELERVLAGEAWCSAVDESLRGPDLDVAAAVVVAGEHGDIVVRADALGAVEPVATSDALERSFRAPALSRECGRPAPTSTPTVGGLALGRLGAAAYLLGSLARCWR